MMHLTKHTTDYICCILCLQYILYIYMYCDLCKYLTMLIPLSIGHAFLPPYVRKAQYDQGVIGGSKGVLGLCRWHLGFRHRSGWLDREVIWIWSNPHLSFQSNCWQFYIGSGACEFTTLQESSGELTDSDWTVLGRPVLSTSIKFF